jgi:hypothetical protein
MIISSIAALTINLQAISQTKIEIAYFFRKTEMVAGFNFLAAGSFQFFSYGAVDRTVTGTFTAESNKALASAKSFVYFYGALHHAK